MAPQHSNRNRQYHQSSCSRGVHNLRRLQSWGACCQNLTANGRLSPLEAKDHINVIELKAVFSCNQNLSQTPSVCLRMDNTTVVSHIYNKGGTHSPQLATLTLELWQWCLQKINSDHRSALPRQTQHCGRQRVKRVLQLQRTGNRPTSDPALPKKVQCRSLCVTPNGSPFNLRQLETRLRGYLHRCNDPRLVPSQRLRLSTIQSDATSTEKSISWQSRFALNCPNVAGTTLVASPPEPVNQESCHDSNSKHLLRDPASPLRIHPMYPRLHLAVFQLSGNSSKQKGSQRTLPEYCNQQLVPPHIRLTSESGDYGIAGVLNGKLIQFKPPSMMSFSSWQIASTTGLPIG